MILHVALLVAAIASYLIIAGIVCRQAFQQFRANGIDDNRGNYHDPLQMWEIYEKGGTQFCAFLFGIFWPITLIVTLIFSGISALCEKVTPFLFPEKVKVLSNYELRKAQEIDKKAALERERQTLLLERECERLRKLADE